jgi:dephospho-CoA kinase
MGDGGRGTTNPSLAVTGPTGAGKTRFCARLAGHGATVIEADAIGHELLDRPDVRAAVVAEFGRDILAADGRVDRRVLGPRVFASPERRACLDALVHPALAAACNEALRAAAVGGSPLVILEAAVYFLLPGPPPVDLTVTVTAAPEVRARRLMDKGLDRDEAEARIAAQAHLEPGWRRADRVVVNDGDRDVLRREADALWREMTPTGPTPRKDDA